MAMVAEHRLAVIAEARTWLGTPYHHQGMLKGVGVDCAMILCAVYHAVGLVPLVDPRPYPPDWHLHREAERYLGWIEQYGNRRAAPDVGDIVVYQFGRAFSHGGIYLGEDKILHSLNPVGVIISHINDAPLEDRPRQYWSLW